MNDTPKRIIGYGTGASALAVLVFFGFIRKQDADAMTLLSSADVQLRLVRSFPEKDKDGRPNAARAKMLVEVGDLVRRAREQEPRLHAGIELAAHLSWMNGHYEKAAILFQEAQATEGSTPESSVQDRLNEARMWRAAESPEKALEVLEQLSGFLVIHAMISEVHKVHTLLELKRPKEALALAKRLAQTCTDGNLLIDLGKILESQGETKEAEAAYSGAITSIPAANYFLARLKIRSAQFDSGLGLLKKAVDANARQVGTMLRLDEALWQPVRDDSRFKDLKTLVSAPTPGR